MSVRKSCYTCKNYRQGGFCESSAKCGENMDYWEISDVYREAETVPVVMEKDEPESKKVKNVCNNCLWWNETCHNKKSCCYGDYKDYNGFCGWFEPENAKTNVAAEIFKAQNHDSVNHPSHYTAGGIECIEALKAATTRLTGIEAVCTANAIKYLWRWKDKNGAEDIRKAIWYCERLLKEIGNEQT